MQEAHNISEFALRVAIVVEEIEQWAADAAESVGTAEAVVQGAVEDAETLKVETDDATNAFEIVQEATNAAVVEQ